MKFEDERDGYYFDTSIYPVFNENGTIKFAAVFAHDVTNIKKAEEQAKNSLAEKDLLLSETHYRVKNNFQVISSLLNLQAKRIEDKLYADIFHDNANRIQSMAQVTGCSTRLKIY